MAKFVKVANFKNLEDALQGWLTEEEREITSGNVELIGEMVQDLMKTTPPEVQKKLAGILGRLVSVEKQLDGLNDILVLN